MKYLLHHTATESACYEHGQGPPAAARVLVCSTPDSRKLLTEPQVTGHAYRTLLAGAVAAALELAAGADPLMARLLREEAVAVVNILRGGLSFAIDEALAGLFAQPATVSFVGTERGAGHPLAVSYERWEFTDRPVLVLGDIIGTGATAQKVLTAARDEVRARGTDPSGYVVVTIGSGPGVDRLRRYFTELAAQGDRFQAWIIALEGLFGLPERDRLGASFPQFPFDFLRDPNRATPEFERHRLLRPDSLFEKCAVYDGGVRAFTPAEHHRFRAGWWGRIAALAGDGNLTTAGLARSLAGLGAYQAPFEQWRERLAWSAPTAVGHLGADHADLYALGREALALAERTPLASWAGARTEAGSRPHDGHAPSDGRRIR